MPRELLREQEDGPESGRYLPRKGSKQVKDKDSSMLNLSNLLLAVTVATCGGTIILLRLRVLLAAYYHPESVRV